MRGKTSGRPTRPIFVDCDTGIDDALALAYLLSDPDVEIVGVGTVSGNVSASRAAANTLALLEAADRADIPVAVGRGHPLRGEFSGGAPHVHGRNGVGGIALGKARRAPEGRSAIELLDDLALQHPGLTLLALGPLTNVAEAVESRPHLVDAIDRVVVMGGAFSHAGNVSAAAEANIYNDPEAAGTVFAASWPLTIVPLDVTMRHALTDAHRVELARVRGAVPQALVRMLDVYLDFYHGVYGARQGALHDPLAAMIAAGALRVTSSECAGIGALLDGADRGRTVYRDGPPSAHHEVVLEVDGNGADVLLSGIRRHPWP
ncbi:nucleoside hydrolase [Microbacterium sp. TPD7012]|uniref:nucleoside hydrolase n=1 Tax=Microbacterium sp. TPD7012 TaxID=2171975 RepID=UPI000D5180F9|nr:nucleoside hydrolase [Microbacterium sp. TPD7012]PVE90939.1 nucleoside hydrolase [Microbacterium sp. TPD7012]